MFTAAALQSRWYVLCGNHDHYGNASAEVAYTKRSQRWFMPELYYTEVMVPSAGSDGSQLVLFYSVQVFAIPGTSRTLQLVMIDTVVLAGLTDPILRGLPPAGPVSTVRAEDEWQWIEQTLASSTADWIIVAGHYPGIYSIYWPLEQLTFMYLLTHHTTQCGL